jgi:hypothetical protein
MQGFFICNIDLVKDAVSGAHSRLSEWLELSRETNFDESAPSFTLTLL